MIFKIFNIRYWLYSLLLLFYWHFQQVNAQNCALSCDFKAGGAVTWITTGNNINVTITNRYVLVDIATQLIAYSSPSLPIYNVAAGNYAAYTVNYDNISVAPNLNVGTNLNAIGGTCVSLSNALNLSVCDVTGCNYGLGEDVTWITSDYNTDANFTTRYVLVDALTGLISHSSATLPISDVALGTYIAYTLNYDNTLLAPNISVGSVITEIGGMCVSKSNGLFIVICAPTCNNILESPLSNNTDVGITTQYVLTDGRNYILQTSDNSLFSGLSNGVYNVCAIDYDTANPPNLDSGTNLLNIGGSVVDMSCPVGAYIKGISVQCSHEDAIISNDGTASVAVTGGTGTYSYIWNNNATTAIIDNLSAGTYSVTVTDGAGCSAICEQEVLGGEVAANINPMGATTFCAGDDVTLVAEGGDAYIWSTGATTQFINASTSGTYTVTVSNSATGYSGTASQLVTVNPLPIVSINALGATTFCEGDNVSLMASDGGSSYLWNTGATTQSILAGTSGNYSVTVTNANACTASATQNIIVNTLPTVNAGADQTICAGDNANLSVVGSGNYIWSNGATTATTTVSPLETSSYTVTVSNAAGCTSTDVVTVIVNQSPTAIAGNNGPLCDKRNILLFGSGGSSYTWSGPNGFSATEQNPVILATSAQFPGPGTWTYNVTVTIGTCSETASTSVTINQSPEIAATANGPLCIGNTLMLYSNYTNTTNEDIYQWSGPNGFSSSQANPIISNISAANAGIYTLLVSNQYSCVSSSTVFVSVYSPPNVAIIANPTCNGSTSRLFLAVPNAGTGSTYTWSGAGVTGTSNSQNILGLSPGSQTYNVTVTNLGGCSASGSITVAIPTCTTCAVQAGTPNVSNTCANLPIDATITGNSVGAGITTKLIVTNNAGVIQYIGNSPIPPQPVGNSKLYSYVYQTQPTTPPTVGAGIGPYTTGAVTGGCYDISDIGTLFTVYNGSASIVSQVNIEEGDVGSTSPFYYNIDEILVEGGSLPYDFTWDNNGYVRYDIEYGDYDNDGIGDAFITIYYSDNANWRCTITDDVNCGTSEPLIFTNVPGGAGNNPNPILDIDDYQITNDNGSNNGSISINVSGGTPCAAPNSYTYQWSGPNTWTGASAASGAGGAIETISGLSPGWYSVTVSDCSGQTTEGWYWVPRARRGRSKVEDAAVGLSAMPNPFSQETTIEFYASQDAMATIEVYAMDGKRVATLYNDVVKADEVYNIQLSAANLAAGVYTVVLNTDKGEHVTYKVVVNR